MLVVVEHLLRLLLDAARDHVAVGVESDLAGGVDEVPGHDHVAVRWHGPGHVRRLTGVPGHPAPPISSNAGKPAVSPTVVATAAPQRAPCSSASAGGRPARRAARYPALNASPAPTGSTSCSGSARCSHQPPPASAAAAPLAPRLRTTSRAPSA